MANVAAAFSRQNVNKISANEMTMMRSRRPFGRGDDSSD